MTLRHILEYEDHEIQDLLGDLETVGLADKKAFSLWVSIPGFKFSTGYDRRLSILVALVDPIWSAGSLERDKPKMLESLQEGRFTRPPKAGLDWKTLEGEPNPQNPERRRSQEAIRFLAGPSLAQFFSGEKDLDMSLENLKTKIYNIMYDNDKTREGEFNLLSSAGIVYGRSGDLDLQLTPSESFRQALYYNREKGHVFYEDLNTPTSHRTFPFA
jgi:hypothetical protein